MPRGDANYWAREYSHLFDIMEREKAKLRKVIDRAADELANGSDGMGPYRAYELLTKAQREWTDDDE